MVFKFKLVENNKNYINNIQKGISLYEGEDKSISLSKGYRESIKKALDSIVFQSGKQISLDPENVATAVDSLGIINNNEQSITIKRKIKNNKALKVFLLDGDFDSDLKYQIHHIDLNPNNYKQDNIALVPKSEHNRLHHSCMADAIEKVINNYFEKHPEIKRTNAAIKRISSDDYAAEEIAKLYIQYLKTRLDRNKYGIKNYIK